MTDAFTRSWLPTAWLDEVAPEPQADPNRFIRRLDDGTFELRAPDDWDDPECWRIPITEGETVTFYAYDDYGTLELTIADDRSFTTDRPAPAGARQFWIEGEHETVGDSLDEMVANLDLPIDAGEHTVHASSWEHQAVFRFEVGTDGAARLIREGAVQ